MDPVTINRKSEISHLIVCSLVAVFGQQSKQVSCSTGVCWLASIFFKKTRANFVFVGVTCREKHNLRTPKSYLNVLQSATEMCKESFTGPENKAVYF